MSTGVSSDSRSSLVHPGNADAASRICRELQEKYMLTFLAGDVVSSLSSASVKLGLEYRLIPLGSTPVHGVHFVDIITRVALMFGGVVPGDPGRLLAYANQRAKAIAIVFPGLDNEGIALVDALRLLGIPIISLGGYEGGEWITHSPTGRCQGRDGTERDQGHGHGNSHSQCPVPRHLKVRV